MAFPPSDNDEPFIPQPPSDFEDSSSETQQTFIAPYANLSMYDRPRPLRAVRYSTHKKRWSQTSNCARGIKEPLPSSIRLLSWNVDYASQLPKRRLHGVLSYIQHEVFGCKTPNERPAPCCILLQEVSVRAFTLILTNEWIQKCFLVVPSSTDKWIHNATYGTVTLVSRTVPVCSAFTIDFSNSRMQRNALFVDIKLALPGPHRQADGIVQVRIANTHLESLPQGARERPGQLEIVADMLQEYELHGGVVAGDMNAISPSDATLPEDMGMVDAWRGGDEDERGFTWGYQPECEFPPGRLDKVLYVSRGGMEVEEPTRVGIGAVTPKTTPTGSEHYLSDHYGLVTNVHVVRQTIAGD